MLDSVTSTGLADLSAADVINFLCIIISIAAMVKKKILMIDQKMICFYVNLFHGKFVPPISSISYNLSTDRRDLFSVTVLIAQM